MVHRGFTEHSRSSKSQDQSKENAYSRTPNPSARNYSEEMAPVNGIRELSEEQLASAEALREKFRDEVSKRMGELLLRGVTMLDAYCQVCNGILMEDRNGIRTCVTCELFAERTREGSRLVAEVPLDITSDGVSPGNSLLSTEQQQQQQPAPNVVRIVDIERKHWAEGNSSVRDSGQSKSRESTPSAPTSAAPVADRPAQPKGPVTLFAGCSAALQAVDRKLQWAGGKIDRCENPSEIRELFALVSEGLNIIKCFESLS